MSKTRNDIDAPPAANDSRAGEDFETLLQYLKQSRGFDFTAYKRSSLMRRVLVRMKSIGIASFTDYLDYLEVDPNEFTRLFNTILINVTSFFRDAPTWEFLARNVIPPLLGEIKPDDPIRVWSAGCASGEEAYTIAMILAEAIGPRQFQERVKIYGTDVDEEALTQARHAVYPGRAVEEVPSELLAKYFDSQDDRHIFNKELRRNVIFGRHDLIQDAPISRINLLACRNCLMYFNAEAQAGILARFQFALANGGILFLGKAETLLTHSVSFRAIDVKQRVFTKAPRATGSERTVGTAGQRAFVADEIVDRLREASAEVSPLPQLLVDAAGKILQINAQLRAQFALSTRDLGRPLQDIELSYRPVDLRSCIDRAYTERHQVVLREIAWHSPAGPVFYDLLVVPVPGPDGTFLGCSITFADVSQAHRLQEEVQRTHQELETALEELQSTNEELETTNEELQSTVEELETTNEELQSTNEELETMNEELQSTNQELQTINDEVRERSEAGAELNTFLESILTSLRGAVVMLNRDLQIQKWNHRAEDLWGVRSDEVLWKNFLNLDIGLPVEQLKAPIRACLAQDAEFIEVGLDGTNRRGKPIRVKVTCTQVVDPGGGTPRGVILVMEEVQEEPALGENPK